MLKKRLTSQQGVTLVELVVTVVILSVLASVAIPMTRMTSKRVKELELRRNLRIIRTALDDYKKTYDKALEEKRILDVQNKSGYPESLDQLVEGYDFGGLVNYKKRFLRRIPVDPFHPPQSGEKPKWGLRSYTDDPEETGDDSEGDDVFDVYSMSEDTAIDGTKYNTW